VIKSIEEKLFGKKKSISLQSLILQLLLPQGSQMNFIWPVRKPQYSGPTVHVGQRKILAHPPSPVNLDGAVKHIACHLRHDNFNFGNFALRPLSPNLVNSLRRVHHEQPSLVDLAPGFRNLVQNNPLLRERFAEGRSLVSPLRQFYISFFSKLGLAAVGWLLSKAKTHLAHQGDGTLGHSHQPHAVVDPSRTQPCLRYGEAFSLAKHEILSGDSNVVEENLTMPVWRVEKPKDAQGPSNSNSRSFDVNKHLRELVSGINVNISEFVVDVCGHIF